MLVLGGGPPPPRLLLPDMMRLRVGTRILRVTQSAARGAGVLARVLFVEVLVARTSLAMR